MTAETYPRRENLSLEEAIRACGRLAALGHEVRLRMWATNKNPYYRTGTVMVRVSTSGSAIGYMSFDTINKTVDAMKEEGFFPYFSGSNGGDDEGWLHIGTDVALDTHEPHYGDAGAAE